MTLLYGYEDRANAILCHHSATIPPQTDGGYTLYEATIYDPLKGSESVITAPCYMFMTLYNVAINHGERVISLFAKTAAEAETLVSLKDGERVTSVRIA